MPFAHLSSFANLCISTFMLFAVAANAQTPAPLSTLDLKLYTNGTVYTSVRLADGSIVFGGSFSQINGVERRNLARLNADGGVDMNWNPGTDYPVIALAADGKNNIYVGGNFSIIGNQSHYHIAKLSANGTGTADPNWNGELPCSNFHSLAINSAGDLFVGSYSCFVGTTTTGVVKLSGATGALVSSWVPQTTNYVTAIAVDADDNLYLGGTFSSVGGQPRKYLAKVSSLGTGALDPTWNPAPTSPAGIARINALVLDGKGSVFVGGSFTSIGGQTRNNIAKLSTTGTGAADATWSPSANNSVNALAIDSNGRVIAGGAFTSIGGQSDTAVARLSATDAGNADTSWHVATLGVSGNIVNTIVPNKDGSVYVGGFFSMIADRERHSFAKIASDGSLASPLDAITPTGIVNAIASQPNGGVIVGGYFSGAGDAVRGNALRLKPDGSIDPTWNPSTDAPGKLGVEAIATDSMGNVYLGGEFSQVGGLPRSGVAKVSASGQVDKSWGGSSSSIGTTTIDRWYYGVEALALSPLDNSVIIGGDFNKVGGQVRSGIAKISAAGVLDPSWNPSVVFAAGNYGVRSLAVDAAGSIFLGGDFLTIAGQSKAGLAKVLANGNLDSSFNSDSSDVFTLLLDGKGNLYTAGKSSVQKRSAQSGLSNSAWNATVADGLSFKDYDAMVWAAFPSHVHALALAPNGDLFAGGLFGTASRNASSSGALPELRTRPYLAKFSASDGAALDLGWNPVADDAVYALAVDDKGTLYTGGVFSIIGGQLHNGFAAIPTNDGSPPSVPNHLNQFGWTGAWYNRDTSGQGILLQIIPSSDSSGNGTLFGGWFTYDSPYSNRGTGQRWYTLQGPVDATSRIASVPVYATSMYPPSSPIVAAVEVGRAMLTFNDCTHATLTYSVYEPTPKSPASSGQPNAVGDGSMALTRLGGNPACSPSGDSPYSPDFLLSGGWYDPKVKFSGLVLDVDVQSNVFFAAWYRNVADGNPDHVASERWYTIQGPYSSGVSSLQNMPIYQGSGGVFDTPSKVTTTQVGTGNVVFKDCANATFNYSFTSGRDAGTSGQLDLIRGVFKPSSCNP
ncbi:hypothetical protein [Rudaea sp.]|uniref:hypothetical protein n=1 Tax=Rudaea sp. TaxID=2136325 RepID=UPI002ED39A6A